MAGKNTLGDELDGTVQYLHWGSKQCLGGSAPKLLAPPEQLANGLRQYAPSKWFSKAKSQQGPQNKILFLM